MRRFWICVICFVMLAVVLASGNNQGADAMAYSAFDDMSARSYVVMDQCGNVLVCENPDEKMEVASICKLMTTLLTFEAIDNGSLNLESELIASPKACAAEGSQAFLDAGSKYMVKDLLKSVIVASANDSAIVLAEGVAGSESNFVKKMNDKAKKLGMHSTMYCNSTGLEESEQFSTARDTAILLNKVSEYPLYQEYCQIWMDELVHPSGRKTELVNTNRLIKYYDYCLTGKTGFTDAAGYCLSSTAKKDDLKLTCVVLGCNSPSARFKESIELYNYAYANFTNAKIVDKTVLIDNNINVLSGKQKSVKIAPKYDYYLTKERDKEKKFDIQYILPESIVAPIAVGAEVGQIRVVSDGEILFEIPIIVVDDIEKQGFGDILNKIYDNFKLFN